MFLTYWKTTLIVEVSRRCRGSGMRSRRSGAEIEKESDVGAEQTITEQEAKTTEFVRFSSSVKARNMDRHASRACSVH